MMFSGIYVFHQISILYVFKLQWFSTLPKTLILELSFLSYFDIFFIKNDFYLDDTIMPATVDVTFINSNSIFLLNYKCCRQTLPSVQCP
jgi:hypothetical protein